MAAVVWVEIPVLDLERARSFYATVFDYPAADITDDGVRRTATLFGGSQEGQPGFSLNQTKDFTPSDKGPLLYLQVGEAMEPALAKVKAAGGAILTPKTSMGDAGSYALIRDTEGNVLALYDAT